MKALMTLFVIVTLFLTPRQGSIQGGNEGAPVKAENGLVCSGCVFISIPADNSYPVSVAGISSESECITPGPAKAAMKIVPVEDTKGTIDTQLMNYLRPDVPREAGFSDDDLSIFDAIRSLAPKTPTQASFDSYK